MHKKIHVWKIKFWKIHFWKYTLEKSKYERCWCFRKTYDIYGRSVAVQRHRQSGNLIVWPTNWRTDRERCLYHTGWFFSLVPPLKILSTEKLIYARLGVSWPIYINIDSPNLGFPYFIFFRGGPVEKKPPYTSTIHIHIHNSTFVLFFTILLSVIFNVLDLVQCTYRVIFSLVPPLKSTDKLI